MVVMSSACKGGVRFEGPEAMASMRFDLVDREMSLVLQFGIQESRALEIEVEIGK